ncbi:MAG: DUF1800 family protein [Terracidiphilus sp.]
MRAISERIGAINFALPVALLVGAAILLTGCGSFSITNPNTFALISGPTTIRVNQQIQYTSPALNIGSPMTFSVNGIPGGNSEIGTIDNKGLYTAPAIVPVPNTVNVTAVATDYPSYPQGSAAVGVLNPIPIIGGVTPSTFPEGTAQVVVTGSQFVYGAQIVWNGAPVLTTMNSSSELIAVIPAPNPGTYPLLVSNPNPGSANSATVPVLVGPGQVVLTLEPNNGSDVRVSNQLSFGLMVNGTNHTGVTLQVNGVPGGNAQWGTAVSNTDGSITYTAPPTIPVSTAVPAYPNVVQLTITSTDNPAISISQNISVLNPIPILNSATPMNFNVGPPATSVVLTGQSFINGAQVLVNGAPVTTTFNSGTQLTASLDLNEPGNLDLQVLNPSPGPAKSADLIALVNGTPPLPVVTPQDASRFLEQATFGATDADIHHLSLIGFQPWLNEQFAMPQTLHEPAVEQAVILNNPPCAAGDVTCNAKLFEGNPQDESFVQDTFWQQSIAGNDQLRQRVEYALTSLLVISTEPNFSIQSMPRGEANYYDVLGADAFGNFRTLLQDVTLNPMMGQFLNMLGNDKGNANTDPDENYAREIMQLFTVGLYKLNDDGSVQLDSTGNPLPTYSNTDVLGLAAVFTGFGWNIPGNNSDTAWGNCCLYVGPGYGEELLPMQSFPGHHSTVQKQFLGVTIPASGSSDPDGDLKFALDTIFNHPNLPPFFCKQMIQHLVTSNPSPGYISRCSGVFKNDGTGVRGNLKAVITEILLDTEARNSATDFANPQYGKVRESLLRYTEWARAFTAQSRTGSYDQGSTEDPIWGLGEMSLRSPTVFNWFAPNYIPPSTTIEAAGLESPEMQMTNVSTVVGYINYMQDAIGSNATGGPDMFSSYETEMALASTPNALLDRINLLLMAGEMDSTLYGQILGAINAIPIPTGNQTAINAALANRVQTAIYLTMASPSFSAQF